MEAEESKYNAQVECQICSKVITNKYNLKLHMRTHSDERPFSCEVCPKTFKTKQYLSLHMRLHTGDERFTCEICNRTCVNQPALIKHMRLHTGEKPFSCSMCEMTFIDKPKKDKHEKAHLGELISCHVCGMSFATREDYCQHKKIHKEDPKPFQCDECEASFFKRKSLNAHKKTHTGVKPYSCEICAVAFFRNTDLNTHKKSGSHNKLVALRVALPDMDLDQFLEYVQSLTVSCDICGKSGFSKNTIGNHKKVHITGKQLECGLCDKVFANQRSLRNHKKSAGHLEKLAATGGVESNDVETDNNATIKEEFKEESCEADPCSLKEENVTFKEQTISPVECKVEIKEEVNK